MTTPVLSATGLTKRFGAIQALADAELELDAGEVHGLVGSNGAGKSTLVKILTGAIAPDAGEVQIGGTHLPPADPRAALAAGVACIYQHAELVPDLTVLDNILLGRHRVGRLGLLQRSRQRAEAQAVLGAFGFELDIDARVRELSLVHRKTVEIVKALARNARVLLMDEPTASLSHHEVEHLFAVIKELKARGVAIVYISHLLGEVFTIADRVTVLRDGRVRLSLPTIETTRSEVVTAMLGRELLAVEERAREAPAPDAAPVLACRGLGRKDAFHDISFDVRRGEVVCFTGLVGSRRTDVLRAIAGERPADSGEICLEGKVIRPQRPAQAIRLGIGYVPEDRLRDGLFRQLSVRTNVVAAWLPRFSTAGVLRRRRIAQAARVQVRDLGIVPRRDDVPVAALSGGNQQKVLLARLLAGKVRVLLLDEPTVGVDVGAKVEIYMLLKRLTAQGAAVLAVSSDIEEVLAIADRVLVMSEGRVVATLSGEEITQDRILAEIGAAVAA